MSNIPIAHFDKDHYMNPHNAPSTMTLDEMKLAVCEKLPELIKVHHEPPIQENSWLTQSEIEELTKHYQTELITWWKDGETVSDEGYKTGRPIHWPTEGLQVCHEAEKLLLESQKQADSDMMCSDYGIWVRYNDALRKIVGNSYKAETHATYEQHLETLCRVWFPERFK